MIKHLLLLTMAKLLLCHTALAATQAYPMPRTHVAPITNSVTGGLYELYIKLPESYDADTDKSYPVVYTTDAYWHMDLLSGATEFLMPEVILVGISWQKNMPATIDYGHRRAFASRFRDYSFVAHEKEDIQTKYQFGQADMHLAFIRHQVMGYVEDNYRTNIDENAYLGYSMGAEFGAYILLSHPDTFKHYILGSPSLDLMSFDSLKKLEAPTAEQTGDVQANVFVSIGELEESRMDLTQQFTALLKSREGNGLSVSGLEVVKDSDHSTAVPETFVRGIKWLKQLISKDSDT
ncbi:alpha/beta hydrolase-fold protein [Alteromonas sp. KUL49]|uniref:alpha/beta hydrolase n=1 Tax=Alteromonas sp. KUL49 TaxID=2480798 RepID=UPI00102F0F7C|nr:alpha/beta hydrolase-fold protein [Alteromonas sp. KUL49]TAP42249.1 alpha/beta hydrolase [Alteromonas sp. KUL49]GEA09839.1 esterase [Alteromonas sp. KUL49]